MLCSKYLGFGSDFMGIWDKNWTQSSGGFSRFLKPTHFSLFPQFPTILSAARDPQKVPWKNQQRNLILKVNEAFWTSSPFLRNNE